MNYLGNLKIQPSLLNTRTYMLEMFYNKKLVSAIEKA